MKSIKDTTWTTFYNRPINFTELSHQHLSNIIYYFELLLGKECDPRILLELNTRFGGIKLPYSPMISFTSEIEALVELGYTDGEINSSIIVNGKWVGQINYN